MYKGERFNSWTHLVGAVLAFFGAVALICMSVIHQDPLKIVAASVYAATLVLLYLFSTLYHSIRNQRAKAVLRKFDYCAIYLLIAGTYTPYALVTLHGAWGWTLFGLSWGLAVVGIVQELVWPTPTRMISLVIYVVMGWLVLIAIKPLLAALPTTGMAWLAIGGLLYTGGVYFFLNDERVPYYHGVWHLFVLAGSLCQYVSILFYVV
jgi:hemolysin III